MYASLQVNAWFKDSWMPRCPRPCLGHVITPRDAVLADHGTIPGPGAGKAFWLLKVGWPCQLRLLPLICDLFFRQPYDMPRPRLSPDHRIRHFTCVSRAAGDIQYLFSCSEDNSRPNSTIVFRINTNPPPPYSRRSLFKDVNY